MTLDKVQIYYMVLLSMGIALALSPKEGTSLSRSLASTGISLILSLPMVGRIFGWW